MVGALGSADVFDGDVRHDLVHRVEHFVARFLGHRLVDVDPQTGQFLFDGRPHVTEESARSAGRHASAQVRMVRSHGRHGGHRHVVELVIGCTVVELTLRVHVHRVDAHSLVHLVVIQREEQVVSGRCRCCGVDLSGGLGGLSCVFGRQLSGCRSGGCRGEHLVLSVSAVVPQTQEITRRVTVRMGVRMRHVMVTVSGRLVVVVVSGCKVRSLRIHLTLLGQFQSAQMSGLAQTERIQHGGGCGGRRRIFTLLTRLLLLLIRRSQSGASGHTGRTGIGHQLRMHGTEVEGGHSVETAVVQVVSRMMMRMRSSRWNMVVVTQERVGRVQVPFVETVIHH